MPFVRMPGVEGRVWEPDAPSEAEKKHPCNDCYRCQMCGDDRCRICRGAEADSFCKRKGGADDT